MVEETQESTSFSATQDTTYDSDESFDYCEEDILKLASKKRQTNATMLESFGKVLCKFSSNADNKRKRLEDEIEYTKSKNKREEEEHAIKMKILQNDLIKSNSELDEEEKRLKIQLMKIELEKAKIELERLKN